MITYSKGVTTYSLPQGLGRRAAELVAHAAASYGFLLNAPGRRSVAHTWRDFCDLIRTHFAPSPQRDAVLSALASL